MKLRFACLLSVLIVCVLSLFVFAAPELERTYSKAELLAIAQRVMNGQPVTPEEKAAAYPTFLALNAQRQSTPPATDLTGGPDGFGYRFMDSNEPGGPTYSWITPSGTTVSGWNGADDGYAGPYDIGFTFRYYGLDYTQFYPGTNGRIQFGTPTAGNYGSWVPDNYPGVYFWNSDMMIRGSTSVIYQNLTSPNRLVVTYTNLGYYSSSLPSSSVSCQIILFETGDIIIQYGTQTSTQQYCGGSGLYGGTTYYYLNYSTSIPTPGTAVRFFTLGTASNPSPADGASNVVITPTLSWAEAAAAIGYDVYFGTTNPPTTRVVDNQQVTTYTPDTLAVATQYWWQVIARSATSTNPGPIWTFTTGSGIGLLSPNGGETYPAAPGQGHRRQISWYRYGGAGNSIDLYLSSNSGVTWPTTIATNLLDTGSYWWTIPNISGSTYRLKVVLRDGGGAQIAADSSDANFSIDNVAPTGTITLVSPADGAIASTRPTFSWTRTSLSGAVRYEVVKFTGTGWQRITQTSNVTTTTVIPSVAEAIPSSPPPIAWRVHAVDAAGNWVASTQTWSLNIDGIPPEPFSLTSPSDQYWTNLQQPTFQWQPSSDASGAVTYKFYLDDVLLASNINQPSYTPTSQISFGNHTWYVVAVDPHGNQQQSNQTWNLTVGFFEMMQPTENQWLYDSSLTFTWNNISAPGIPFLRYDFRIDGTLMSSHPSITDTSYQLPAELALGNGSHTCYTQAIESSGTIVYTTPVRNLRIDRVPPLAFNLSTPTDNAVVTNQLPSFSWVSTSDAGVGFSHYELWINGTKVRDSLHVTSSTAPTQVSEGAHTWYVVAVDLFGNRQRSNQIRTVVIDVNPPIAAIPISPINGDTSISARPTFRWLKSSDLGSGVQLYRLYVAGTQRGGNITHTGADTVSTTITDSLANGFYEWYIRSYDGLSFNTTSNYGYFYVLYGRITVIKPNTGITLYTGITDTIRWSSQAITGNVKVELNREYPSGTWETLFTNTANDGSELWIPTAPATTAARVRISSLNNRLITDVSDNNFTISSPAIHITQPNGGDIAINGETSQVLWTTNLSGTVTIKANWSYPSGAWTTLSSTTSAASGSFSWIAPVIDTQTARFAIISNLFPTISDTSDANFRVEPRRITILSPNGGEILVANIPDTIRWSANFSGTAAIGVSRVGPSFDFTELIPNAEAIPLSQGSLVWTPELPATMEGRIVIAGNEYEVYDWSDNDFQIVSAPMSLQLLRPNGGEIRYIGEPDTIAWTSENLTGSLTIEIKRNYPVDSWQVIDSTISTSAGLFLWSPTTPVSENARIRIRSNLVPSLVDTSNASFSIRQRSVVLTRPNGGETFRIASRDTIRFAVTNLPNGVRIELNRAYPTGEWTTLVDSVSSTATYWVWNLVDAPATTTARIRVMARGYPAYGDTSSTNFAVQPYTTLYSSAANITFPSIRPHVSDSVLVAIANRSNLPFRYNTIAGVNSSIYSHRVLDTDSIIGVNDTLKIRVKFRPDSTVTYLDTLRITFDAPYDPISIPLNGTGIGYYASLSANSYNFPTTLEPTRKDSTTIRVVVRGNRQLLNADWITLPAGMPFRAAPDPVTVINPNDSLTVKLYFEPTTQGVFTGQVALVCNGINEDTLRINLSGSSQYIPSAPGGLSIVRQGEDMRLNWVPVDTSINGVPLVVSRYLVFFRNTNTQPWNYLASTLGANTTLFTHERVVTHSAAMYYEVRAWIGDGDSLDRILRELPVGTPEDELWQRLK
ncbi:MAG: hypothetical protein OEM52_10315 [bacterium]|nr:hypothetical protein [bacterium]